MDLSNNQVSKKKKSNPDDESSESELKLELEEDEKEDPDEQDEQEEQEVPDETYEPKYDNVDLLDTIAIARETYFFTYMDSEDEINSINERDVLKFIYEQVANTYSDVSLLEILGHIKHYYNLTFPEHERIVALFYLSFYPQAVMTDRMSAGLIGLNSEGNEVTNSFIQISGSSSNLNRSNPFANIFRNLINPSNPSNLVNPDISFNLNDGLTRQYLSSPNTIRYNLELQQNSREGRSSSLLNEIMFLSTVFNMRSNESLLNVLNLMNNIMDRSDEDKETASNEVIKELGTQVFSTIGLDYKEKNSDFCTICQENYSDDSNLKILPCGHFFHCDCIEPWLLNCSNLCPICRKKI